METAANFSRQFKLVQTAHSAPQPFRIENDTQTSRESTHAKPLVKYMRLLRRKCNDMGGGRGLILLISHVASKTVDGKAGCPRPQLGNLPKSQPSHLITGNRPHHAALLGYKKLSAGAHVGFHVENGYGKQIERI